MTKPQAIDDKFAQAVLALEEAAFELEDILENHEDFTDDQKYDLLTSKKMAESARDFIIHVIASISGKKLPNHLT